MAPEGDQMQDSIHPERMTRWPRACLLMLATLVSGVLVAGCAASAGNATASGPTPTGIAGLAFAECMRSNGVPNFPDPSPGGGFVVGGPAINPSSPAVSAAKEKCQEYVPILGGSGGPAFSPQVQEQALAKLLKIAQCMRQHGIADFPDPSASRPSNIHPGHRRDQRLRRTIYRVPGHA
jgi:hypothetical protein